MLYEWNKQNAYVHEKGSLVQRFCQDIGKLFLGWHMDQIYVPILHIVSQKVVAHLNLFGFWVEHRIFGNAYGTSTITHERNVGALLTKVTESIGDPKQMGTVTSHNYILSLGGRLSYTWLFARRPRNQQGTQELVSTRSRFLIDTTPYKVGI
jgi:hypothetical protein